MKMLMLSSGATPTVSADIVGDGGELLSIPLSPPEVSTWLYQCLVDCTVSLRDICGGKAAFDQHGMPQEKGLADVALLFGSHLGARRSQAMISWDYDADAGIFFTPRVRILSNEESAQHLAGDEVSSQALFKALESRLTKLGASARQCSAVFGQVLVVRSRAIGPSWLSS